MDNGNLNWIQNHVDSCEGEKVLIEYALINPILFEEVVECVVNNEKVYLTKEDLALSSTKIEVWFTKQNKFLAFVLISHLIGVVSFIVGRIMVKKWFNVRNTVGTIKMSVIKVAKQVAGAISLLKTIRGGET